jgi:hypothetical protein
VEAKEMASLHTDVPTKKRSRFLSDFLRLLRDFRKRKISLSRPVRGKLAVLIDMYNIVDNRLVRAHYLVFPSLWIAVELELVSYQNSCYAMTSSLFL